MDEAHLCVRNLITAAANQCEYVKLVCKDESEYINFIQFYYCDIDQDFPLIVLVSILVILFVFNFLETTTDTYLAPTLETITEKLKLSEAIAGVTLLALANGATDVIAGIVAGAKESGGVSIAIGGLFGACFFSITVVIARCIQGAGEISVESTGLKRDISFLLITVFYFLFLTVINQINWISALGFFVIYIAFISYVVYVERGKTRQRRKTAQNNWALVREKLIYKEEDLSDVEEQRRRKTQMLWHRVLNPYILKSIIVKRKNKGLKRGLNKSLTVEQLSETQIYDDPIKMKEVGLEADEDDHDTTLYARCMRVYNIPLFFVRNLTMPPFEAEKWNVYMTMSTPIFGLLFLLWQVNLIGYFNKHKFLWIVYAVISLSLSVFLYLKGRRRNLAAEHGGKFAAISFAISTLWLNLIANCFVDLLALIKVLSGLPLNYLSLTLLAWGNSLADIFIDYAISKSGHGRMAIIGVYAGMLFNLLIGFGGSMLIQALKKPIVLDLYVFKGHQKTENVLTLVLLASLVIGLIATYISGKRTNWVIGKPMMYFLVIFYFIFFMVVSLVTMFV